MQRWRHNAGRRPVLLVGFAALALGSMSRMGCSLVLGHATDRRMATRAAALLITALLASLSTTATAASLLYLRSAASYVRPSRYTHCTR